MSGRKEAGSGRLRRPGFTVIRTVSTVSVGLVSTLVSPSLVLGHGRFSIVHAAASDRNRTIRRMVSPTVGSMTILLHAVYYSVVQ